MLTYSTTELTRQIPDDYSDFADYIPDARNNSCIGDMIAEYADGKTNIYNDDLFEWAKGNISVIDDTLKVYGNFTSITQLIATAQAKEVEDELFAEIFSINRFWACQMLESLGVREINENQVEKLDEFLEQQGSDLSFPALDEFLRKLIADKD